MLGPILPLWGYSTSPGTKPMLGSSSSSCLYPHGCSGAQHKGYPRGLSPPEAARPLLAGATAAQGTKRAKGCKGMWALQLPLLLQHGASPGACSLLTWPASVLGKMRSQGGPQRTRDAPAHGLACSAWPGQSRAFLRLP